MDGLLVGKTDRRIARSIDGSIDVWSDGTNNGCLYQKLIGWMDG